MATRQSVAQRKYDDAHTTRFFLKLHNDYDADIIATLKSKASRQGYIKELIRRDIEQHKNG